VAYEWSRGCAFDQMQSALEEKENANKQLWQVTKVKERFAANASHGKKRLTYLLIIHVIS